MYMAMVEDITNVKEDHRYFMECVHLITAMRSIREAHEYLVKGMPGLAASSTRNGIRRLADVMEALVKDHD